MTSPTDGRVADSVRLAWPAEAAPIAELQRRSWGTLPAAMSESMLSAISLADMTTVWHQVITRPPKAEFRVLVAVDGDSHLIGFATTLPSEDTDAEALRDGEVDQFVIDPPARQRGHGSRLLNACADTLRADGFERALCWVLTVDDAYRRFLTDAGWAPDGAHREIGTEDESVRIKQIRLHTDLRTT
ncbi:MAG TPA: GNAT family N-acetyltransferase [Propionibacteriaceae bacterium]